MILTSDYIKELNIITPYENKAKRYGLSYGEDPVGYDITIAQDVILRTGETSLCSSFQHIDMPLDIICFAQNKSTNVRRGINLLMAPLDPGWKGYITLELSYNRLRDGPDILKLGEGYPIGRLFFYKLIKAVKGYDGKYQNQPNRVIPAILEDM